MELCKCGIPSRNDYGDDNRIETLHNKRRALQPPIFFLELISVVITGIIEPWPECQPKAPPPSAAAAASDEAEGVEPPVAAAATCFWAQGGSTMAYGNCTKRRTDPRRVIWGHVPARHQWRVSTNRWLGLPSPILGLVF